MNQINPNIGFSYFDTPEAFIERRLNIWMSTLSAMGGKFVIFSTGFKTAIPEDVIVSAVQQGLDPIIHFKCELPLGRYFNQAAVLVNAYAKWGVKKCIFGERPNLKSSWPVSGWQHENLVDHFLDRYIPLASHAVRLGIQPFLAPMHPGGDFWDTAFLELTLLGLQRRRLDNVLDQLALSCYGWTFGKPLDWGSGGPNRWPEAKPYENSGQQQNQVGFSNYEWAQSIGRKTLRRELPILILDCGNHSRMEMGSSPLLMAAYCKNVQTLLDGNRSDSLNITLPTYVHGCSFSLPVFQALFGKTLSPENVREVFKLTKHSEKNADFAEIDLFPKQKLLSHYLLLPRYDSGVPDAILRKIRPYIKRHNPTMGFSLEEAALAERVTVYDDPKINSPQHIARLRTEGCIVEILPNSGMDIATSLRGSSPIR